MRAIILLEDGTLFEGESVGASGTVIGEAVFSTCMTGYQEMLTDPSFAGQLLTLTYPLVGNYGVNSQDVESNKIQVEGFIIRELCEEPSNWRMKTTLKDYLVSNNIVSVQGVDTRAITRHLRVRGVMMGAISTELTVDELKNELKKAPKYGDLNFVEKVSTKEPYEWLGDESSLLDECPEPDCKVAIVDLGVKRNIARCLVKNGCRVVIMPCFSTVDDILSQNVDGVVFSPGPGDPAKLTSVAKVMVEIMEKKPVMGICLGHQMLGTALGGKTKKLKFGHRGANHPVKNLITGKVSITSQNHGYVVDAEELCKDAVVSHINLNDGTVEGLKHSKLPVFSAQYHPEASAGPLDEGNLFWDFVDSVRAHK
ncbi:MAG: glutamine-hydrolyzing carbamoyl-phosphate synthase small subunit [Armatimonadota bacterium]